MSQAMLDGQELHVEVFGVAEDRRTTSHELIDAVPGPPQGIAVVRASAVRWGEAQGSA